MNIQNSHHLLTARDYKRHACMVVTTGTALCIAHSTRVAVYAEMSVANTGCVG